MLLASDSNTIINNMYYEIKRLIYFNRSANIPVGHINISESTAATFESSQLIGDDVNGHNPQK